MLGPPFWMLLPIIVFSIPLRTQTAWHSSPHNRRLIFRHFSLMWCSCSQPTLALKRNKTKWPGQIRKLILDSDSESGIFDFWPFEREKEWRGWRRKIFGEGRYLVGARDEAQRRKEGKYLERENILSLEEKKSGEGKGGRYWMKESILVMEGIWNWPSGSLFHKSCKLYYSIILVNFQFLVWDNFLQIIVQDHFCCCCSSSFFANSHIYVLNNSFAILEIEGFPKKYH